MKMKQVYESNPALGDPMSIQGQLTENGHRLDKLRSEQKKFQVQTLKYFCKSFYGVLNFGFLFGQDFLDELEGKAPNSPAIRSKDEGDGGGGGSKISVSSLVGGGSLKKKRSARTKQRRSSVSDGPESLSRSGSDSSVSDQRRASKTSTDAANNLHG